jgi:hypothetical protein
MDTSMFALANSDPVPAAILRGSLLYQPKIACLSWFLQKASPHQTRPPITGSSANCVKCGSNQGANTAERLSEMRPNRHRKASNKQWCSWARPIIERKNREQSAGHRARGLDGGPSFQASEERTDSEKGLNIAGN